VCVLHAPVAGWFANYGIAKQALRCDALRRLPIGEVEWDAERAASLAGASPMNVRP
jgi:hypothetical protein